MGRSYKKWARPALMAGWIALAGGCAAPTGPAGKTSPATLAPAPVPAPPPRQSAADQRFVLAPELERVLQVVSVRLTNPPGAYLKIQVNVQNKTDAPQRFRYRIEWFDRDGAKLPLAGGEFMPWMLLPREMSSIAVTAPSPAAADFEIALVPDVK
jgi:hypothetical protein